jgi:hypothetical protein
MSHVPWDLIEHDAQRPSKGSSDVATGDRQIHGQLASARPPVRLEPMGTAIERLELMLRQRPVGVNLEADGIAGHNPFIVNERQERECRSNGVSGLKGASAAVVSWNGLTV